jgi:hypothetical protein
VFSVTRRWLHQFNAIGIDGLGNRPGCGRKQRITEAERSRIIAGPVAAARAAHDSITAPVADLAARIRRHRVLGGLIHECEQAA